MLKLVYQRHQAGFTLLELLIAISIFSVLSVMAYGGLKTVLDARSATQKVAERTAEIQLAMFRIHDDLKQAVARSVRDGIGASTLPAMMTQQLGNSSLEWTRAGYINPGRRMRSNLQRISYEISWNEELSINELVRRTWPDLDRLPEADITTSVLLSDIEKLEWQFNNLSKRWVSDWPPPGALPTDLPRAVAVNLTLSDLGEISRTFLIPHL